MLRFRVSTLPCLGLLACTIVSLPSAAFAADIEPGDYPPGVYGRYERYEPAPYPAEGYYGPRIARPPAPVGGADGYCRIRHERRVDIYGREVIRRIRVCDDGVVAQRPPYDPPPRYYRPPRAWSPPPVDPGYEDEE